VTGALGDCCAGGCPLSSELAPLWLVEFDLAPLLFAWFDLEPVLLEAAVPVAAGTTYHLATD
jgi:hypothetical protein